MKNILIGIAVLLTLTISACNSTGVNTSQRYDEDHLKTLPQSYFDNMNYSSMTPPERSEVNRRVNEKRFILETEAACVFGSSGAFDRKKLGCEKIKGSPEYKALHGES